MSDAIGIAAYWLVVIVYAVLARRAWKNRPAARPAEPSTPGSEEGS